MAIIAKEIDQIASCGGDERSFKKARSPTLYLTSSGVSSAEGDEFQTKRIWPCVKKSLQYALTGSIVFAIMYLSTETSFLYNGTMVGGQLDVSRTMKTASAGGYVESTLQTQNIQKEEAHRKIPGENERSVYINGNETKGVMNMSFDVRGPSKKILGNVEETGEKRGASNETKNRTASRGTPEDRGATNETSNQSGRVATNETIAAFNEAASHTGRGAVNDSGRGATNETTSQTGRGALKGTSEPGNGVSQAIANETSSKWVSNNNESTNEVATTTTTTTTSDLKIALYMTTHLSARHKQFLERCWTAAVKKLPLLQQVDLIVYTSNHNTTNDKLYYDLGFRNVTIHRYSPLQGFAYQGGAAVAMLDPFLEKHRWFDGYDWVIRTNPDVLIRNDEWLLRTMKNESYDGVFVSWWNNGNPALHTDFFAFRPKVANTTALFETFRQQKSKGVEFVHAETHLYAGFQRTLKQGRVAWLPNAKRRKWAARVEGIGCDVVHTHEIVEACPNYFNATDGEFY